MEAPHPLTADAAPYPFSFDPTTTALVVIDMQRDFLEPGGFGESLGNDVGELRRTIAPLRVVLAACRAAGMMVVHTREGHLPDLSDCPPSKLLRGSPTLRIGDPGPRGRVLVRGEEGHDIIEELYPAAGEAVIDKPGKGAFYATGFGDLLAARGIRRLVVTGVTTEVCVHTTVREANDRGYECLVLSDCVGSYFPQFHRTGLEMIRAQGGHLRLDGRFGGFSRRVDHRGTRSSRHGGIGRPAAAVTAGPHPAPGQRAHSTQRRATSSRQLPVSGGHAAPSAVHRPAPPRPAPPRPDEG
ncbi:Nicotinamidase-related amidase [Streptomyces sp. DvalAA-14]|uniref:cysteine hydrolase family protein n=1 Tax=unclassified Streptomyces TaxID=2593676 RepID=UPI00081B1F34|nr:MULTISPECIES: isochorismatase family cysteine hydrolase [unclassified Streptomyces]SCE26700.1 Nicotinamidase-related amidase [Streptomyces sp. DvalAA-14]